MLSLVHFSASQFFITLHYRYSTLNLYEFDFYAGADQYFYGDDPSYDPSKVSGNSAVVTGCDAWTIYEYVLISALIIYSSNLLNFSRENYGGYSVCLYPSDQNNCYPSFFPDPLLGKIYSVRKGCYSKNIVWSDLELTMKTKLE